MTITKSEPIVWLVSHLGKKDGTFSVNESMDLEEIGQYKSHLKSAKSSGMEIMHFCETLVKGDGERYVKEIEFMSNVPSELGL